MSTESLPPLPTEEQEDVPATPEAVPADPSASQAEEKAVASAATDETDAAAKAKEEEEAAAAKAKEEEEAAAAAKAKEEEEAAAAKAKEEEEAAAAAKAKEEEEAAAAAKAKEEEEAAAAAKAKEEEEAAAAAKAKQEEEEEAAAAAKAKQEEEEEAAAVAKEEEPAADVEKKTTNADTSADDKSLEVLVPPLAASTEQELSAFLAHRGEPWIKDIAARLRGDANSGGNIFVVSRDSSNAIVSNVWIGFDGSFDKDWKMSACGIGVLGHVHTSEDKQEQGYAARCLEKAIAEFESRGGKMLLSSVQAVSQELFSQQGFSKLLAGSANVLMLRCKEATATASSVLAAISPKDSRQASDFKLVKFTRATYASACLALSLQHAEERKVSSMQSSLLPKNAGYSSSVGHHDPSVANGPVVGRMGAMKLLVEVLLALEAGQLEAQVIQHTVSGAAVGIAWKKAGDPPKSEEATKAELKAMSRRNKCVKCTKTVYPMEKTSYDDMVWHKTCFKCQKCNTTPSLKGIAMYQGNMFCKNCFKKMFAESGGRYETFASPDAANEYKWKDAQHLPAEVKDEVLKGLGK